MGKYAPLQRQWLLGLLALALLTLAAYLAYPSYLLSQASAQLEAALTAPDDPAGLAAAIASLEQAHDWRPADLMVLRRLAQAYLAADRPADAVAALETARRIEPASLMVSSELIDGYLATGRMEDAVVLLRHLGVNATMAEQWADKALLKGDGKEASRWLERAVALAPEREQTLAFRRTAAVLLGGASASDIEQLAAQADLTIYTIDQPTRIPASELRWLIDMRNLGVTFGDRTTIGAPAGTGVLWWGARTIVVIDVPAAGTYQLRVKALEDKPPPIHISVQIDGQPALDATLTRGDRSWALLESTVTLQPGPQAVVVRLLNDATVDGVDRNATLAWLELTPLQP